MKEAKRTETSEKQTMLIDASWLRGQGFHYVTHDLGQLCMTCATDHPLTGDVTWQREGECYNCHSINLESKRATMCGKRTARFMCTLPAGHKGPHGRNYRREVK